VRVQHHSPAALYPQNDSIPIVQEAGWPQVLSGQVRKISPPPGFDPRTVQPVASRYTDYATQPTESTISTGERPQTYALDRAAAGTGLLKVVNAKFLPLVSYRKLAGRPRHWAVSDRFSCNSAFEAPPLLHTAHALTLQTLHIVHTQSSCVAFDCHNKQRYFTSAALIDLCLYEVMNTRLACKVSSGILCITQINLILQ
jgi:hypothetical protein